MTQVKTKAEKSQENKNIVKNYSEPAEQNLSEVNKFTTLSTSFCTSPTDQEYPIKKYRDVRQMSW